MFVTLERDLLTDTCVCQCNVVVARLIHGLTEKYLCYSRRDTVTHMRKQPND